MVGPRRGGCAGGRQRFEPAALFELSERLGDSRSTPSVVGRSFFPQHLQDHSAEFQTWGQLVHVGPISLVVIHVASM